jgi:tetratricopeptide (TPR) repeat protein
MISSRGRMLARIVAVLALLLCTAARADEDPSKLGHAQRYERARRLFDDALAHYNLGDYDTAAIGFSRAYLYDPQPMLLYNLAQVAARQNRHEKAIDLYRRYLALAPPNESERVQPKIDEQQRALEAQSPQQRSTARLQSGLALLAHNRLDDAAEELNGGFALDGKPAFLAALGEVHERQHDRTGAVVSYRRFLELAPPDDPARGHVQAALDRLQPPPKPETTLTPPPAAPERSRARKLWWIAPVAAVVVVGVALGIYFGTASSSPSVPSYPVMFPR